MGSGMWNRELLPENLDLHKFPGHTVEYIAGYVDFLVKKTRAKEVIIIAGTNDVSRSYRNKTFNKERIAENIIQAGKVAARCGANKVWVSGLFFRTDAKLDACSNQVNELLKTKCSNEGFKFLDQSNIGKQHISTRDKLHLSDSGNKTLRENILNRWEIKEIKKHEYEDFKLPQLPLGGSLNRWGSTNSLFEDEDTHDDGDEEGGRKINSDLVLLMDSNKKWIDMRQFWRAGGDIVDSYTTNQLEQNIEDYDLSNARHIIISVGTNDVDRQKPDAVAGNLIRIATKLKDKYKKSNIYINQLPPRKFKYVNETERVNALLTERSPKNIKVIVQSDLEASHLRDDKHIKREYINLMTRNMKDAIRETSRPSSPKNDKRRPEDEFEPPRFDYSGRRNGSGGKGDRDLDKPEPNELMVEQMVKMVMANMMGMVKNK